MTCHCGHVEDEHGLDDEFPGSTACAEDDCECIAFEADEGADEEAGGFAMAFCTTHKIGHTPEEGCSKCKDA